MMNQYEHERMLQLTNGFKVENGLETVSNPDNRELYFLRKLSESKAGYSDFYKRTQKDINTLVELTRFDSAITAMDTRDIEAELLASFKGLARRREELRNLCCEYLSYMESLENLEGEQ